ncbi:MAG: DUF1302 domain-containing protein [Desulfobacteraceae bacterium]|nr:DUF1302 domain-containing protein [Desulfobacteraceae bacterium]
MNFFSSRKNVWKPTIILALVSIFLLGNGSPVKALQLHNGDAFKVNLDTTISWGAKWRVEDRDPDLIQKANGGNKDGANGDNGNLNFDQGMISNAFKITSDLEIRTDNFGLFTRGTAFYDYEIMEHDRKYVQLGNKGEEQAGTDIELLDAYVWGAHDFGEVPVMLKVGDQVVNWGESTFIGNSINAINPIDAGAIRVPGAEIREALIPEGMVYLSVSPTLDTSIEALYLYDWGETEADASGTYFSSQDYATPDGFKAVLDTFEDMGDASVDDTFMAIPRSKTREADDQGQWGLSVKTFVPALNDTEFGFYYLNYHSRLPVLSATTGTKPAKLNKYLKTAKYYTEYPEDIQLFGVSFSTEALGWAMRGEVSHRLDVPYQIDDKQLIAAAVGAMNEEQAKGNLAGNYFQQYNTDIEGYRLFDVSQAQVTFTKIFSPIIGADGGAFITEVGYTHVHDLPNDALLESPGGIVYHNGSWGYRSRLIFNYLSAIGAVNLFPRIGWNHDVQGTSPGPGRTFLEHRKAVTLGLKSTYQSWSVDVSYATFFGAGKDNKKNDRDFIGCSLKYSF